MVTNPAVPSRIRQLIAVESGLNDGIVTPVVLLAIAGAATAAGLEEAHWPSHPLVQLVLGAAVGASVGAAGGMLLRWARRRDIADEELVGIAVLALALLAYAVAVVLGWQRLRGRVLRRPRLRGVCRSSGAGRAGVSLDQMGSLVSLLVWLTFGAIAVPVMVERLDVAVVAYAVLSLTVLRMVPVGLALLGTGFDRRRSSSSAWFGPRGLASLVFALLALEELGEIRLRRTRARGGLPDRPAQRRTSRSAGPLGNATPASRAPMWTPRTTRNVWYGPEFTCYG